jgi:RNA polymerase sigma-70 factor (ECF subfamily)
MRATATAATSWFSAHQRFVWGLAYRMTGSAADADDAVQDTFARAVERPPPRQDEDMRPWLAKVAMNVSRDALRKRRRQGYVGPWLPSPVDGDVSGEGAPDAGLVHERREGAAFAFLIALEALSPAQRAVLLLRDVFDYSVPETSQVLGMTETHVKVVHHRARAKMRASGATPDAPPKERSTEVRAALERFLAAIASEDPSAVEACLAEGVRAISDGGGEFVAALKPVVGKDRVTRFLLGVQKKFRPIGRFEIRAVNGEPALVADFESTVKGAAPRWVMRCETDEAGLIRRVHMVLATRKLTHVRPVEGGS